MCPKCEEFGPEHWAECRQRIEKAMIASGDAFDPTEGEPPEKRKREEGPAVIVAPKPSEPPGTREVSPTGSADVPMQMVAAIREHFNKEDVQLEFWKDYKAVALQQFPI